jgi:hypothetical protein
MKNHPQLKLFMMCFVLMNLLSVSLYSQTKKISMQGFLKDANGKAVADGDQSLTFKIYTTVSGGVAIWSEDQTLKVFGGVYSAQLGQNVDIATLAWDVPYYVGVTVQGTELSPRTELTYAPYSFGTNKAQEVVCSGAVGDVKYSILNPTQFAAVNGACWVPMDGRSITGSKLATITGLTTVTNAGGLFLRGQEFLGQSANHDPDRDYSTAIATLEDQAMQTHQHGFSGNTSSNDATTMSALKYFYDVYSGNGGSLPGGVDGNSMEEGQGAPDRFMRHNTVDLRGYHSHSFSGTTNNNNGFSAVETRPKNLNLWTYIRIN